MQRLGQRVALDDDYAGQDRDGQGGEHAAPHPVPAGRACCYQLLVGRCCYVGSRTVSAGASTPSVKAVAPHTSA